MQQMEISSNEILQEFDNALEFKKHCSLEG